MTFTFEKEIDNQLPFLDILVQRKTDETFETSVYRKEANADVIQHYEINHPVAHKRSALSVSVVARTIISILVGQLRIHRTETGEPAPGAPTHSRDRRLHCYYCTRAFTHRMGLFGHMRIHDSGIHRNADNTDTSCTPSAPAILTATADPTTMNDIPPASTDFSCPQCARNPTTMNDIPPASTDFSCPQCARNLNPRIGLVDHL
ncbi:unnamed protein product [Schistocephalus solidus]|uniref:C2H2-type domain-containing protein n=1 Tax=Schistocephalus solidus TaxID=70667 RepID=A0A183S9Y2_SCHSO|nr:unnamed protein product [Schistocephalus solidus]